LRRMLRPSAAALCVGLLATLLVAESAAVAGRLERLGPEIAAAGFNPATFFSSRAAHDPSVIRIFHGDQFGRPIYAIAVRQECLEVQSLLAGCRQQLVARMARAPLPSPHSTPRDRAIQLARRLIARRATSQVQVRAALSSMALEWMEADLRNCPGAMERLERIQGLAWLPPNAGRPQMGGDQQFWLDTDVIEVTFDYYPTVARFSGVAIESSPGAWARDFAQALEPCWRPAQSTPPWRM
jgi:hypothetical protein